MHYVPPSAKTTTSDRNENNVHTDDETLQLAVSKVKENAFDEAIALLKALLNNESKYADVAHLHLMNAYKAKKDTKNASNVAQHILEKDSSNISAMLALIDIAISDKKYDSAIMYCEEFYIKTNNITIQLRNAYIRRVLKDFDGSKKILHTILEKTPSNSVALFHLSMVYFDTGQFEQAIDTAAKIERNTREFPGAAKIIIDSLINSGKHERALEHIENYLSQNNPSAEIILRKFKTLKNLGLHAKAKELIDITELTFEQRGSIAFDLLKHYKRQFDYSETELLLQKLQSLHKNTEINTVLYAEGLYALNKQQQLYSLAENTVAQDISPLKLKHLHYRAKQLCLPEVLLKEDAYLRQSDSDELFNIYAETLVLTGDIYQAYSLLTQRLESTAPTAATLQAAFNILCQLKLYEKAVDFLTTYQDFVHWLCKSRVSFLLHVLNVLGFKTKFNQLLQLLESDQAGVFYPQILWAYVFNEQPEKAVQYYQDQLKRAEDNIEKQKNIQREAESFFIRYRSKVPAVNTPMVSNNFIHQPSAITYLNELLQLKCSGNLLISALELAAPRKLIKPAADTDSDWYSKICNGTTASHLFTYLVNRDYNVNKSLQTLLSRDNSAAINRLSAQNTPCVYVSTHFGAPGALAVLTEQIEKSLYLVNPYIQLNTKNPLTEKAIAIDGSLETLKPLKQKLKQGYSLIGALDQRPEYVSTKPLSNTITMNVFGCSVEFSSFLPRIIWSNKLPSMWVQVRYNNGKAELQVANLPQVTEFTNRTAWQTAWLAACAAEIEAMLKMDPNNCVPTAPIWKQLFSQVFAEDAKKIASLPLPE